MSTWEEQGWKRLGTIGEGGHGKVFLVQSQEGLRGALKLLINRESKERRSRFHQEMESLKKLCHPSISKILDYSIKEEEPYLITEFIDGVTLTKYFERTVFDSSNSIELILKLLNTVDYCHRKGIIHRDIKPGNIMMVGNDPILIDFGLSFDFDSNLPNDLTYSEQSFGNRFFRLPEHLAANSKAMQRDARSDLCSVVGVFFYLLTGLSPKALEAEDRKPPHLREAAERILRERFNGGAILDKVLGFFDKGFQYSLDDRYQTVLELQSSLFFLANNGIPNLWFGPKIAESLGLESFPNQYIELKILIRNSKVVLNRYEFLVCPTAKNLEGESMRNYHFEIIMKRDMLKKPFESDFAHHDDEFQRMRIPKLKEIPRQFPPNQPMTLCSIPCRISQDQFEEISSNNRKWDITVRYFRKNQLAFERTFSWIELGLLDSLDKVGA